MAKSLLPHPARHGPSRPRLRLQKIKMTAQSAFPAGGPTAFPQPLGGDAPTAFPSGEGS